MDKIRKMEFDIDEKKLHYQQLLEEFKTLLIFFSATLFGNIVIYIQALSQPYAIPIICVIFVAMLFAVHRMLRVRRGLMELRLQIKDVYEPEKAPHKARGKSWYERLFRV